MTGGGAGALSPAPPTAVVSPPCPGQAAPVDANSVLARFNAIPAALRDISVTQAIREWMVERYPCPT